MARPLRDGNIHVRVVEADPSDDDWVTGEEDPFDTGDYDDETISPEEFTATITAVGITDDNGKNRRPGIRFEPSSAVLGG